MFEKRSASVHEFEHANLHEAARTCATQRYAASIALSTSSAAALCSGSLRLPHFGDCTHDGQPLSHGHSPISACASRDEVLEAQ